ncbi:MAG: hypothetical protein RLZZ611_351 [Cyanobacteriota bacterium]|jgi:hypothetical protein
MTPSGTWYPPELGTGGFLLTNPPFAPMTDDITATLQERGQRYGKFTGHARITQELKLLIAEHTPGQRRLPDGSWIPHLAPDQQEALDMICHKIGRILSGDPDYADSWHDIAGYAQLVADRLNGVER